MEAADLASLLHSMAKMRVRWQTVNDKAKFRQSVLTEIENKVAKMDSVSLSNVIWYSR